MGQFSKVPKVMQEAFEHAYNVSMLGRTLDGFAANEARKERDLAAFRGGIRDYRNEKAITEVYRERNNGLERDGRILVGHIMEKIRAAADDSMAYDLARAAQLAPLVPLLDGSEVMRLARQNRDDVCVLRILARADCPEGRSLGSALARCDEALTTWIAKVERFALRALAGANDVKKSSDYTALVDVITDKLQDAWDGLSTVIDGGQVGGDPLANAVLAMGGEVLG
jgi:hypothetical protein